MSERYELDGHDHATLVKMNIAVRSICDALRNTDSDQGIWDAIEACMLEQERAIGAAKILEAGGQHAR